MASAVYFCNAVGKPLLSRNYKGDIPESSVALFSELYPLHQEPCFSVNGTTYMYVRHSNIMLLAVSRTNANAASIFVFLHHLLSGIKHYFKDVQEESVRDNFVILYELLDEVMDYGLVQITDINILQDYITQNPYQLQALSALTGKITWRQPGIFYRKNELFVDVIETASFTLDPDGQVSSSLIAGRIAVKSYLSGMPQLKLGFNDLDKSKISSAVAAGQKVSKYRLSKYVRLEDMTFHQSVDLEQFEADRTISFVPPDGAFDLLTYRTTPKAEPPFVVATKIDVKDHSRVLISCEMRSTYKKRVACSFVEFNIPVPPDGDSPRFKATHGSVVYAPESNAMVWRITDFPGGKSASMSAQLMLPATGTVSHPAGPVQAKFEIPALALSGLEIRYLKVVEEQLNYNSYPWVRYICKAGDYDIRRAREKDKDTPPPVPQKDPASSIQNI